MKKYLLCTFFILLFTYIFSQQTAQIKILTQGYETNLRALSVFTNDVLWASGSNGFIARSTDGGNSFTFQQLYNYDKAEFRDIYGVDSNTAFVMSSVQPSSILKTTDGGKTWKPVFETKKSGIFLDGFDFWDAKNGIAFGDPVNNRFLILTTHDGGITWNTDTLNTPEVDKETAAFAASGSSIQCVGKSSVYFATGGKQSLLFFSKDYGKTWKKIETPMQSGFQSSGIFSIDFINEKTGSITGGDYTHDKTVSDNFYFTENGGKTWQPARTMPNGYRSSVKYVGNNVIITCGPSGVDAAFTDYYRFRNVSIESYNTVQQAREGKAVYFVGDKGKIGKLE